MEQKSWKSGKSYVTWSSITEDKVKIGRNVISLHDCTFEAFRNGAESELNTELIHQHSSFNLIIQLSSGQQL